MDCACEISVLSREPHLLLQASSQCLRFSPLPLIFASALFFKAVKATHDPDMHSVIHNIYLGIFSIIFDSSVVLS